MCELLCNLHVADMKQLSVAGRSRVPAAPSASSSHSSHMVQNQTDVLRSLCLSLLHIHTHTALFIFIPLVPTCTMCFVCAPPQYWLNIYRINIGGTSPYWCPTAVLKKVIEFPPSLLFFPPYYLIFLGFFGFLDLFLCIADPSVSFLCFRILRWPTALTVTTAKSPCMAASTSNQMTTPTASHVTTACSQTLVMSAKSWSAMMPGWGVHFDKIRHAISCPTSKTDMCYLMVFTEWSIVQWFAECIAEKASDLSTSIWAANDK